MPMWKTGLQWSFSASSVQVRFLLSIHSMEQISLTIAPTFLHYITHLRSFRLTVLQMHVSFKAWQVKCQCYINAYLHYCTDIKAHQSVTDRRHDGVKSVCEDRWKVIGYKSWETGHSQWVTFFEAMEEKRMFERIWSYSYFVRWLMVCCSSV